ncbi:DUF397 domain-containing protein [Streptomyces sp. NPDC001732]
MFRAYQSTATEGVVNDLLAARLERAQLLDDPNGDCLEVADGHPGIVPVRDSKVIEGPTPVVRATAWTSFIADLKHA